MINRAALCLLILLWLPGAAAAHCISVSFDGASYTVCRVDLANEKLRLYLYDGAGKPYGSFAALAQDLAARGETLKLAMNAGMYHADLKPVGLYVADGAQLKRANSNDGPGNFHLKPNGVFYVAADRAGVMETGAFLAAGIRPDLATQSGPMLVIGGKLHPRFLADSTSRKRRNGIGVLDRGRAVIFAISEEPVTFHAFARLFRDQLKVRDALFLDGTISSLFDAASGRHDRWFPMGPILGVVE